MSSVNKVNRKEMFDVVENGGTIISVTGGLSHALKREYAERKRKFGCTVWETPDILPLNAWMQRTIFSVPPDSSIAMQGMLLPLDKRIETAIWEEQLSANTDTDSALNKNSLAMQLMHSFAIEQQWQLSTVLTDNYGAETNYYISIRNAVIERCRAFNASPDAQFWHRILEVLIDDNCPVPDHIVFAGFVRTRSTAFQALIELLKLRGCTVSWLATENGTVTTVVESYATKTDEILSAAHWAKNLLRNNAKNIAVIFPHLADNRVVIEQLFSEVLTPRRGCEETEKSQAVFELSLGGSLSDEVIVYNALLLLDLISEKVHPDTVSRILLSPFFPGYAEFRNSRAVLDVKMRKKTVPDESWQNYLERLRTENFSNDDVFLRKLSKFSPPKIELSPSEWADYFEAHLNDFGWCRKLKLNSRESQAKLRFIEEITALAGFDVLYKKISGKRAVSLLRKLCTSTIFKTKSENAPIQIMGMFEALGQRFSHLRICDMTAATWPSPARPASFIPFSLQKAAGVADANSELHSDDMEKVTRAVMQSADNVVVSYARVDDDSEMLLSPFVQAEQQNEQTEQQERLLMRLRQKSDAYIEKFTDDRAPVITTPAEIDGGTGVLTAQSNCPFRAFAKYRLKAKTPESPEFGVSSLDRGNYIHNLLDAIWEKLENSQKLNQLGGSRFLSKDFVANEFSHCVQQYLPEAILQAEIECVWQVLQEMLEIELERNPFTVEARETELQIEIAGLKLNIRTDRVDRLENGTVAVIDYKSSGNKKNLSRCWMNRRPEEPQLPLYAVMQKDQPRVSAVAFGQVDRYNCKYYGYADNNDSAFGKGPDVAWSKEFASWSDVLEFWSETMEALAVAFRDGDARVDPLNKITTCTYCEFHSLCRIDEYSRMTAIKEVEDND